MDKNQWKLEIIHTLLDAVSNYIVTDAIYDTEDETTIAKFLKESTANKNKIAITTDLDKKYSLINKIEKTSNKIEMLFKKPAKIQKTNIQNQMRSFKTNIQKRFNLEP